jgi:hypothetical protein
MDGQLTADMLADAYKKCFTHLNMEEEPTTGFTVLASPNWVFVAPLTAPYICKDSNPVYLDGYAYAGILDIQTISQVWPATAGLRDDST